MLLVAPETLGKKFAAQTSVLAAASFLSCLLKYHVWSGFARAKLCFTSEATPFGGVIDARALEQCDLMCMRAGGNDVERERERERCPRPLLVRLLRQAANARVPRWLKLTFKVGVHV